MPAVGQSRELPAAAITVPPPSARLTHFRERGAAAAGGRGRVGKGIDVGPPLRTACRVKNAAAATCLIAK